MEEIKSAHHGYILILKMMGQNHYKAGKLFTKDIAEARRYPIPPFPIAAQSHCEVWLYDFRTFPPVPVRRVEP